MTILAPSKGKPDWLDEARAFCRDRKINIAAWGPDLLTVESGSPERDREVASQFAQIGFHVVENAESSEAGLLDLSRNPEAIRNAIASSNISRRPLGELIVPVVPAALSASVLFLSFRPSAPNPALGVLLGLAFALWFAWYAFTAWTWRLELLPEGLRIRRYGRWAMIPWNQIRAVDSHSAGRRVSVMLELESHSPEKLGMFVYSFGINLRDRLRYELAQRRHENP